MINQMCQYKEDRVWQGLQFPPMGINPEKKSWTSKIMVWLTADRNIAY